MNGREAAAQSEYQASVRQHNGHPMTYSVATGRVFLHTSIPDGTAQSQQEVQESPDSFLNFSDWQPWTKKDTEAWVLSAARVAGAPIPVGEILGEEPDFTFKAEPTILGIELTELLRPASCNGGFLPVAEEAFHQEVLQLAEKQYYQIPDATPLCVRIYFEDAKGTKRSKSDMARSLVQFVEANRERANPVIGFSAREVPEGFGPMSIAAERGAWWGGECGGITVSVIYEQLALRISAKNKLLPRCRANIPNAAFWFLVYSGVAVSRGVPLPCSLGEWRFPFDFERVFFFSCLDNEVVEVQRSID
jgi:hypothetical protein